MDSDVAIFIDLDNVAIGATEAKLTFDVHLVVDYIKKLTNGRIVLRRAYADWRQQSSQAKGLAATGFELQSTVNIMDKNLADMQMVVDAMETLIDGHHFTTYVLVTGDRDFLPLVQALRKRGKVVIGIGVRHTSSSMLRSLVDKYVYYEDLVAEVHKLPTIKMEGLLQQALDMLLVDQPRVPASVLKQQMDDLSGGSFSQSKEGKMSFKKYLKKHPSAVQVIQEETTIYVQHPRAPGENGIADEAEEQAADNGLREASAPEADRPSQPELALHLRYRAELKRNRLRVVPAAHRLVIIRDVVDLLQPDQAMSWRAIVGDVYGQHSDEKGKPISKSFVNDVLRLMLDAGVIRQDVEGNRFSTTAPTMMKLTGKNLFQEAVMRCDATYLSQIEKMDLPFEWEATSLALYGTVTYQRYLKVLKQQYGYGGGVIKVV